MAKKATCKTNKPKAAPKAAKKVVKKASAIQDAYTKSQLLSHLAEKAELTKKQVGIVIDELAEVIERHLKKRGAGKFSLPGVAKFSTKRKPATKARKGVNPFTGEEIMIKAKPARNAVKIRPLKKLKEAAE
ncbi:MAG: HU family DNA-binding protein [Gammaproteobacteria bacterium]|nr:HU family DNA-binding protein [Gammaproteobacteria bacterium]